MCLFQWSLLVSFLVWEREFDFSVLHEQCVFVQYLGAFRCRYNIWSHLFSGKFSICDRLANTHFPLHSAPFHIALAKVISGSAQKFQKDKLAQGGEEGGSSLLVGLPLTLRPFGRAGGGSGLISPGLGEGRLPVACGLPTLSSVRKPVTITPCCSCACCASCPNSPFHSHFLSLRFCPIVQRTFNAFDVPCSEKRQGAFPSTTDRAYHHGELCRCIQNRSDGRSSASNGLLSAPDSGIYHKKTFWAHFHCEVFVFKYDVFTADCVGRHYSRGGHHRI